MAEATVPTEEPKRKKLSRKRCTVSGCDGRFQARGYCVKHYNEFYKSQEYTRVPRIYGTPEKRFHQSYRIDEVTGCWVWTQWLNDKGYAMLTLPGDKQIRANRFSYILKHGSIPDGLFVLHVCDHPPCVNPAHLFLGTNQDNIRDMYVKGRAAKIVRKLTWPMVTTMRVLFARGGISYAELAAIYGVDEETARGILRGKSWLKPPASSE